MKESTFNPKLNYVSPETDLVLLEMEQVIADSQKSGLQDMIANDLFNEV